jgi:hypothetical protein
MTSVLLCIIVGVYSKILTPPRREDLVAVDQEPRVIAFDHGVAQGFGRTKERRAIGREGMVELVDFALGGAPDVADDRAARHAAERCRRQQRKKDSPAQWTHTPRPFKKPAGARPADGGVIPC